MLLMEFNLNIRYSFRKLNMQILLFKLSIEEKLPL